MNPKKASAPFDPVGEATLRRIAKAHRFNRWMFERIEPFLHGEVLEIGSGIGNISQCVIEKNITLSLSDYNPEYQELLREKFGNNPSVKGIYAIDLQSNNFRTQYAEHIGKYDTVFLLNVIEHLANEQLAMDCLEQLLKPGGTLIVLAPSYEWLYCQIDQGLGHYRRYNLRRMGKLFPSDRFVVKKQEYFNFAGIAGWWFFGKLLKRKQLGNELGGFEKLVPIFRWTDRIFGRRAGLSTITVGQKK